MSVPRGAPLALSLLIALSGVAWAGDAEEVSGAGFTLTATIDNAASGGATFTVEGDAPHLPDGTMLHVTLAVKGKYTAPVEAAFFQVRVESNRFAARKAFPKQRFAPEVYWARVELFVGNQRKAIREWVRRQLGVDARAKLLLAKQDIEIGTVEDQLAFARTSLGELRRFVGAFRSERDEVAGALEGEPGEDYAALRGAYEAKLEALGDELRAFLAPYVVWSEQQLIATLDSARAEVAWSLRAYGQGRRRKARRALARTITVFDRLVAEIETRQPTPPQPDPAPSDAPADETPAPEQGSTE